MLGAVLRVEKERRGRPCAEPSSDPKRNLHRSRNQRYYWKKETKKAEALVKAAILNPVEKPSTFVEPVASVCNGDLKKVIDKAFPPLKKNQEQFDLIKRHPKATEVLLKHTTHLVYIGFRCKPEPSKDFWQEYQMKRTDIKYVEFQILFKYKFQEHHLFTIKKSQIKNAGWGLFAGRDFQKDALIGLYYGTEIHENENDCSMYAMEVSADKNKCKIDAGCGIEMKYNKEFYPFFGMHFMNDPNWKGGEELKRKTRGTHYEYNVIVYDDLRVYALKEIKKGEELFLQYHLNE